MGAGQIGGIAPLLDIDFKNAAGFQGQPAVTTEAQFMVYYMSHALLFCSGVLLEAHVVLTPAICIFGERYRIRIFGGTHKFLSGSGVHRTSLNLCTHKGYNHSQRWGACTVHNLGLLILNQQFSFHKLEPGSEYILNRVRYGLDTEDNKRLMDKSCRYYGWGSRRNGYLVPLLTQLYRVDVVILPPDKCRPLWTQDQNYLCIQQPLCKSERFGALCPDDVGAPLVCSGIIQGMMTSRMIDRPCGTGFMDLRPYTKFLTCSVDDSRDVFNQDLGFTFAFTTMQTPTLSVLTVAEDIIAANETVTSPGTSTTVQF